MSRFIKSPDGSMLINLDRVEFIAKEEDLSIVFWFNKTSKAVLEYETTAKRDHVFNKINDDNGN